MLLITALTNEKPDDQEYMLNIYDQYKRIMFHTAQKYTSDFATAEDLVQDSLVKLIPKISTMRNLGGCTLTAYIVNTVKNTSNNHLRRQAIVSQHIVQTELEEYDFVPFLWRRNGVSHGLYTKMLLRRSRCSTVCNQSVLIVPIEKCD